MWWSGLPGMDDAPPVTGQPLADRAVALACAQRVSPVNLAYGNGAERTKATAQTFFSWLAEAQDPSDAHARRLALGMACQGGITEGASTQVLRAARELHGFLTRS